MAEAAAFDEIDAAEVSALDPRLILALRGVSGERRAERRRDDERERPGHQQNEPNCDFPFPVETSSWSDRLPFGF